MLWLQLSIVYANPNLAELDATKFIFIFLAMLYIITSDIMLIREGVRIVAKGRVTKILELKASAKRHELNT